MKVAKLLPLFWIHALKAHNDDQMRHFLKLVPAFYISGFFVRDNCLDGLL